MRNRTRFPSGLLGAVVLALSALLLSACTTPAPEDAPADVTGANYLIDACPDAPDGPLWVFPGTPNSNQACQLDLFVAVDGVAGTGAGGGSCSIAASESSPFSLSWDTAGADVTAEVSAPSSALYVTSKSERQALAQSFLGFRQALVDLQTGSSDCLLPGGAELLAQRLAQAMPLPLDEVPLYRYGYDTAANAVELVPGMRVKIVNAGFFDEKSTTTADITYAFSGTGTGGFTISSGPLGTDPTKLPNLALDPFLSPFELQIGISTNPWKPLTSVRFAASVLDLVSADDAQPYLGLVYSPSTGKVPAIDQPTVALNENPVLVWADTPTDLKDQIALLSGGFTSEACGDKGVCTVFFGRAAIIPEISVAVDGDEVWVPVGTTLRQVIAATRDWTGPDTTPTGRLQNLMQRIIPPFSEGTDAGLVQVTFPQGQGNFNADDALRPSAFDLPLVRGDRITLSSGSAPGSGR